MKDKKYKQDRFISIIEDDYSTVLVLKNSINDVDKNRCAIEAVLYNYSDQFSIRYMSPSVDNQVIIIDLDETLKLLEAIGFFFLQKKGENALDDIISSLKDMKKEEREKSEKIKKQQEESEEFDPFLDADDIP